MRVKLKNTHHSLSKDKCYCVIGIESDYYRILNDQHDPCLYSPDLFDIIDSEIPDDWIVEYGGEGEMYAYPPQLNSPHFFEDYHNGSEVAKAVFEDYLINRVD